MGNKLQNGINDLKTWCITNNREDLLNDWDYSLNSILPFDISYGSHKLVYWRCSKGHSYVKSIHDRCQGVRCPECTGITFKHRGNLFDEYPTLIEELDENYNKYEDVKSVSSCSKTLIYWLCQKQHSYTMSASNKSKGLGCPYCSNHKLLVGFNDLETWCLKNNRQQILDDWNYTKNDLSPKDVMFGSFKQAHFKCHICGYEWYTRINSRTHQGSDCRMCSRRKNSSFPEQCIFYYIRKYFADAINGDKNALEGKELDIFVPQLKFAIEYDGKTWHKESQKDIEKDVLCASKGIILYRVRESGLNSLNSKNSLSYEYCYGNWNALSSIIEEILNDLGIKECDVNIVRDEYTIKEQYYMQALSHSLANEYPDVAKEWDYDNNGNVTPDLVTPQTHDIYSWKCSVCNKTFSASPHNRINAGSGCPFCGKMKAAKTQSFPVINVDTGERFASASDAAKKYNISRITIQCCCKGKTNTAGGFHWKYDTNSLTENHLTASKKRIKGNATKQRKVMNIDTGEIYESLSDAQNKTHIHNISAVCRGVRPNAGGYRWKYI